MACDPTGRAAGRRQIEREVIGALAPNHQWGSRHEGRGENPSIACANHYGPSGQQLSKRLIIFGVDSLCSEASRAGPVGYDLEMADADVHALAMLVAELQTELNRADRATAAELNVGGSEDLQILRLLLAAGPLRVTDLARQRLSSLATASARMDRLEKRGLVVRERIPDDRRAVVVRLTSRGEESAVASRSARLAALAPIAHGFPTDDLRQLIDALSPTEQPPTPAPISAS